MPITLLDVVLIIVMLVSGLLAMVRGFMREVLSIIAWVLAAGATLYSYAKLLPYAKQYFNNDIIAAVAVVGGIFLGKLLVVTVLTVRISDMVLDSRVGALDRTLGFLFGLARGLLIVVVAYTFFDWLVPDRGKPGWILHAKSKVVLSSNAADRRAHPDRQNRGADPGRPDPPPRSEAISVSQTRRADRRSAADVRRQKRRKQQPRPEAPPGDEKVLRPVHATRDPQPERDLRQRINDDDQEIRH